jgi:hypothetical protein
MTYPSETLYPSDTTFPSDGAPLASPASVVSVNGIGLDNFLAQGVDDVSGLHKVPGKRTQNVEIPGRHGNLWVPKKRYAPGSFVIPMWIRGVNPDGTIPSDPAARTQFYQRARALVDLFTIGEQVTLHYTLPDGTFRELAAEVDDVLDFTVTGYGRWTLGKVSVGLTAADPFWSDPAPVSSTATLTTGQTTSLPEFGAASAPMDDLVITFGPSSNPQITQLSTGVFLAYNGIIGAGQKLVVDTGAWTVTGTLDAGGQWQPPSAPTQHVARIRHGGGVPRLFSLAPEDPAPVIQLSQTGGGSATVTISGKQKYLLP